MAKSNTFDTLGGIFDFGSIGDGDQIQLDGECDIEPRRLNISDVYKIAEGIGEEFERLIDSYGSDGFKTVMPKVIGALENLERIVLISNKDEENILILKETIAQLEMEKRQKLLEYSKIEKDVELVEDENKELRSQIHTLLIEKNKLYENLASKDNEIEDFNNDNNLNKSDCLPNYEEQNAQLSVTTSKLQKRLELSNSELNFMSSELLQANAQIEELTAINKKILTEMKLKKDLIKTVSGEKSELQTENQNYKLEVKDLRKQISVLNNDRLDILSASLSTSTSSHKGSNHCAKSSLSNCIEITYSEDFIDKSKTFARFYAKPKKLSLNSSYHENTQSLNLTKDTDTAITITESSSGKQEELVVQGPLPFEPEDAPWKKGWKKVEGNEPGGMKRFFRKILGSFD